MSNFLTRICETCTEACSSQIFCVPKPKDHVTDADAWRVVQDYRLLNIYTKAINWPIPVIQTMIERLQRQKPKYFVKLDLTSSFHQIPLKKGDEKYTAFSTNKGIFCFNRMPMGIKNATAYFQYVLQQEVIPDLIYRICELYIDDLLIYAETFEDLLKNYEKILDRFKKYNITINPKKTFLNPQDLEFVGHIITPTGIKVNSKRIRDLIELEKPTTEGGMRIFLGSVNYMRNHIRNVSIETSPLQGMIKSTKKKSKVPLKWTPHLDEVYNRVIELIKNIPTLFFIDYNKKIHLKTDASNIGMGAYLYQLDDDGKELPIRFLSKKFSGAQLRWHTHEQEAFAIYFALQEWEYLLQGTRFTLWTDHMNLVRLNTAGSIKVHNWKMFIQKFDFEVKHIPGNLNIIPDAFSRQGSEEPDQSSTIPDDEATFPEEESNRGFVSALLRSGRATAEVAREISPVTDEIVISKLVPTNNTEVINTEVVVSSVIDNTITKKKKKKPSFFDKFKTVFPKQYLQPYVEDYDYDRNICFN